jgi:hypothetical protein
MEALMFESRRGFSAVVKCAGALAAEIGQQRRPKLELRYGESAKRTQLPSD